jgi:hypothetical protein
MAAAPPLPKSFEEAARLRLEVETELERVCLSPYFHSSQRSCQFLRYVVQVTLDGRLDSLKERSIGIDLLGRDTSYDPSSDATVRVRANEVRKRLASFYGSVPAGPIRIVLPTGNYVPHFVEASAAPAVTQSEAGTSPAASAAPQPPAIPPLNGLVLMRPTLFALLICVLLLRHQLGSREGYLRFWDHILVGRSVILLSVAPQDRDRLVPGLDPLVWIAGRYGVDVALNTAPMTGAEPATFVTVRITTASPAAWQTENRLHWQMGANGLEILTDRHPVGQPTTGLALDMALLTILPKDPSTLYVQCTAPDALRVLFEELTTRELFPGEILEPLSDGKPVQLLVRLDATGHWTTQTWTVQP